MNLETIKNRRSVRTFNDTELTPDQLKEIENYVQSIKTPFNIPVHLQLLNKEQNGLSSPVIIGAKWYVAGKVAKTDQAEEAFGYAFEDFILKAEEMGLGTVWLAATIKRDAFEKALDVKKGEVMPAVSPIGYAANKMSAREKLMRMGIKSDSRLPFEKIFFMENFDIPLSEENAGKWQIPLDMVRLAPSATNKQPWRVVICNGAAHFYEKKTPGYANEESGDIQKVDLSIAMRHFDAGAVHEHLKGRWIFEDPQIDHPKDMDYIASWVME